MNSKSIRFRFGLRSLLIVMFFLAIGFAWFGAKVRYARKHHQAVEYLLERGGRVYWDYEYLDGRITLEASRGIAKAPGPDWLTPLIGENRFAEVAYFQSGYYDVALTDDDLLYVGQLNGLQAVNIYRSKVTDSGISYLRNLPQIRSFFFRGEGVTNNSIQYLNSMPQLAEIALTNSMIDDKGIEELTSNTKIRRLILGGTRVTDKGLASLRRLKNLTYLDLSDTSITDSGAKFLGELSGLKYLDVNGTKIGDAGIASLVNLKESLGHLCIAGTQVTDECTGDLMQLENLVILEVDQLLIGRGNREREDVKHLTTSQSIESLTKIQSDLPKCHINPNSPGFRKGLPKKHDDSTEESPVR